MPNVLVTGYLLRCLSRWGLFIFPFHGPAGQPLGNIQKQNGEMI